MRWDAAARLRARAAVAGARAAVGAPVGHLLAVEVRQPVNNIVEEADGDIFTDARVPHDVIEELARVEVLHHQQDLLRRVNDLE